MLAKTPKPNGNLGDVMAAVIAQAEHSMNALVERSRPTDAEVSEESADWYLVRTFPGDDLRAMRWLARRKFGVFRPMQQSRDKLNDARLLQGWEPVFPGWLFVFTWDVEKMRQRILSTPGVMTILCHHTSQRPIAVNQKDKEGIYFIDRLRALSWVYDERAPMRSNASVRSERHMSRMMKPAKRKLDKRTLKVAMKLKGEIKKLKNALKSKGKFDPSTWAAANELAPAERIALLQRTLNAPSLVA